MVCLCTCTVVHSVKGGDSSGITSSKSIYPLMILGSLFSGINKTAEAGCVRLLVGCARRSEHSNDKLKVQEGSVRRTCRRGGPNIVPAPDPGDDEIMSRVS